MHLRQHLPHLIPQGRGKLDGHPTADFPIVQRPGRDIAAQHFLQAHGLTAELQGIPGIRPGAAPFVLHGVGLPKAIPAPDGDTGAPPVVFQHVALTGYPQRGGKDADAPGDDAAPTALSEVPVMGVLMHQRPVYGVVVFRPLVLQVNQGPPPPAKLKVLQAGQLEEILFVICHG